MPPREPEEDRLGGATRPGRTGPGERAVAVALKYDLQPDHAPKVVASGRGTVAESILALAFANGVKVRQDADLAELLSSIDVGDEIPCEAFLAVAEVLRYVYQANGKLPSGDPPE